MILDELTYRSEIDQPLTVEQADRNIELLEEAANNKPYYIRIIITGTVNATSVSSAINALEFGYNIDEIRAPVVIRVVSGALTYIYFYRQGKGIVGGAGSTTSFDFSLISIINTTIDSVDPDNPATPIIDLDPVIDGDYISKANTGSYDLTDAGDIITIDGQDYQKTYYFTYTDDSVLYLVQFVGAAGNYGTGGTLFEADDFVATSNSGVEPVAAPDLDAVLTQGNTSDLPILIQVGTEVYKRSHDGNEYRRDDRGIKIINANPINAPGTTLFYTIPAKATNDTFAMQSDIAKNRTINITASGTDLQDNSLIGATAVTAVLSQAYGVLTQGLTFNSTTGTISGYDFTGTGVNVILYDKP